MTPFHTIITHPGGAHKDEVLACALLIAEQAVPIQRREPTPDELNDPNTAIVDIGHQHQAELNNYDHHQFPKEHPPTCSLSLVLQARGLYQDAQQFCDWLEPAEWFDCRGPQQTAQWLGVPRDIINKLHSPIDTTLLRRFSQSTQLAPGDIIWEMMRLIGLDLIEYLSNLRSRLTYIHQHAQTWQVGPPQHNISVLFLPRTDPLLPDPGFGIHHYLVEHELTDSITATVIPDSRGDGYGLARYNDHPQFDMGQIETQTDVHFAHKSGFLAKTSATQPQRLQELLTLAIAKK